MSSQPTWNFDALVARPGAAAARASATPARDFVFIDVEAAEAGAHKKTDGDARPPLPAAFSFAGAPEQRRASPSSSSASTRGAAPWWFVLVVVLIAALAGASLWAIFGAGHRARHEHHFRNHRHHDAGPHGDGDASEHEGDDADDDMEHNHAAPAQDAQAILAPQIKTALVCPPGRHAYAPEHSLRAPVCALNSPYPNGVDASILDNATHPCNDFMRYACGCVIARDGHVATLHPHRELTHLKMNSGWIDSQEPVDRAFREVAERNREVLDEIVRIEAEREWSGSGALGTYVRACVAASEADVAPALRPFYDDIDAIATSADVARVMGRLARYGFETLLYAVVEAHPLDGTRRLLLLVEHASLDLNVQAMSEPDRTLVSRVERALQAALVEAAAAGAAGGSEQRAESMADYARRQLSHDLHAPAAVDTWFPLAAYTAGLGGAAWSDAVLAQPDVWVTSEPYVRTLGALLQGEEPETWRRLLRVIVQYRSRAWPAASDVENVQRGARAHASLGARRHTPVVPWRVVHRRGGPAASSRVHARLAVRAPWLPALRHVAAGGARMRFPRPDPGRLDDAAANATATSVGAPPTPAPGLDPLELPDDVSFDARYAACSREAEQSLPDVADAMYARVALQHIDRREISSLAHSVVAALSETVHAASWLPESRRRLAASKLAALLPRVAVPRDFGAPTAAARDAGPHLVPSGYVANQLEIARHVTDRNLALLQRPRDRDGDFEMRISAVNAYYEGSDNTISILAGILRPPFYSPRYSRVSNAASIGFVLGHEVAHALDPDGSQYGPVGEVLPAYVFAHSEACRCAPHLLACSHTNRGEGPSAAERARYACLVDQYNTTTARGTRIDGTLTLGENVADNTGLPLLYRVLDARLRAERGSGVQRSEAREFFTKYAQIWCARHSAEREQEAAKDVHSPPEFRVNLVLQNMRAFRDAYGCQEGAPMAPARRCTLWEDER